MGPSQISYFAYHMGPLRSYFTYYMGPSQISYFAYHMGPPDHCLAYCMGAPSGQFLCLLCGAPRSLLRLLCGAPRSVSLHNICPPPPQVSFFLYYMEAPFMSVSSLTILGHPGQFLRLLYIGSP